MFEFILTGLVMGFIGEHLTHGQRVVLRVLAFCLLLPLTILLVQVGAVRMVFEMLGTILGAVLQLVVMLFTAAISSLS